MKKLKYSIGENLIEIDISFFHMNYCFLSFWQIKKDNFPKKKRYKRVRSCSADYFFFTKVKEIRFRNMKFFLYVIALPNEPKF